MIRWRPDVTDDARRHAPATERNREPILEVLRRVLPPRGLLLEIASGTGEHAVYLAEHLPDLEIQPTDVDEASLASIDAWRAHAGLDNVRPALRLDTRDERWPVDAADAVLCVNMIHISPWASCEGLFRGARRLLPPGGVLVTYGPYRVDGAHTARSNEQFDAMLRVRDPEWGVRDVTDVARLAGDAGLPLETRVQVPANNMMLVFRAQADSK